VLGKEKQQEVQTHGAIFGGLSDAETRVKCNYNKLNRFKPFMELLVCLLKVTAVIFSSKHFIKYLLAPNFCEFKVIKN